MSEPVILGRQVELLYRNIPLGQAISVINAGLLAWLWRDATGPATAFAWWAVAALVALTRAGLALGFQRADPQFHGQAACWRHRARTGAAAAGATWAVGAALFMLSGDAVQLTFTAFVMAGMVAGAVPVLAADRISFRLYAWPIVTACLLAALGGDALRMAITAMAALFLFGVTRGADHFHQALHDTFRLEQEKDALVGELQEAKGRAEASDHAKSEFLATISHELRTPMTGILGMADLLAMESLNAEQQELLGHLQHSAAELEHKIENMIELSALEVGQVNLRPAPFNLHDLLAQLTGSRLQPARARGIAVGLTEDPLLPPLVVGDQERVGKILMHLTDNAVKFTAAGEIGIDARVGAREPERLRVVFVVRDTGPGIPPDMIDSVCGLFTQVDGSARRRHEGTGIGLPIARKLAELMGGDLGIESNLGQGTTVRVELPFGVAAG